MTIPYVNQTVRDGASGALALGSDLHVKIGVATSGTEGAFTIYTDADSVIDDLVGGPLCEAAAHHIAVTGQPVAVVRVADADVSDGTIGAFTKVGHAGPTISDNSSAPLDAYQLLIEILVGGAVATATFRYSLDNGESWSASIATAATVDLTGSGISVAFASGTYVAGNQYTASTVAPIANSDGISDAIAAALANANAYRMIHIVGIDADEDADATRALAVQTLLAAAASAERRYTYAVMDGADSDSATVVTAFEDVDASRVAIVGGWGEIFSPRTSTFQRRPLAWLTVDRIMSVSISRDAGAVADGSLGGVRSIEHDEFATPAYDAGRITSLRSWVGRPGYYVTRGRMLAAANSDFRDIVRRQVMDAACAVAYDALINFVNVDVVVNQTTGRIDEREAQTIEKFVESRLRAALVDQGHAADVEFRINRTTNILTTEMLRAKTRVLPLGYARYIENELSFRNPAAELTQE